MIRFEGVCFSYPGSNGRLALRDVDLEVLPGEMLAVLGANGSGKSTLARLANGLLLPSSGKVGVDEIDTRDESHGFYVRERVGMVFQHADDQIVATSVEDDIAFGPENLGLPRSEIRARVDAALRDTGLAGLERREPHLLSGGQKQRLAIAGALAMHPSYLVLDEPTSMIDSQGRFEVLEVLERVREAGRSVVLITHDIAEAVRADRTVVIDCGSAVFAGTPEELLGCQERFPEWGLELPAVGVLAAELRRRGTDVPTDAMDAESLVRAL